MGLGAHRAEILRVADQRPLDGRRWSPSAANSSRTVCPAYQTDLHSTLGLDWPDATHRSSVHTHIRNPLRRCASEHTGCACHVPVLTSQASWHGRAAEAEALFPAPPASNAATWRSPTREAPTCGTRTTCPGHRCSRSLPHLQGGPSPATATGCPTGSYGAPQQGVSPAQHCTREEPACVALVQQLCRDHRAKNAT